MWVHNKYFSSFITGLVLVWIGLFVSGCSTLFFHKESNNYGGNGKVYKVGKPYYINGKLYTPSENYHYSKVGVASWYGPNFNGGATANGGSYDMYEISAAHKTLPLSSIVLVTNLENGKSIKVKINDRGPYVKNRIIDLSYSTAQILGATNKGTIKVKVQILAAESRALKDYMLTSGKRGYSLKSPYDPVPKALYQKYGNGYIPSSYHLSTSGKGKQSNHVSNISSAKKINKKNTSANVIKQQLLKQSIAHVGNIYWVKTKQKKVHHLPSSPYVQKLPSYNKNTSPGRNRLPKYSELDPSTLN